MQYANIYVSKRRVADETKTFYLLHRKSSYGSVRGRGSRYKNLLRALIDSSMKETGGIRPAQRSRSKLALTLAEREEIYRSVIAGRSIRTIASSLRYTHSTISREFKRKGDRQSYWATQVDLAATPVE
jgi:DNA-binding NarL/FixJ family response regulator